MKQLHRAIPLAFLAVAAVALILPTSASAKLNASTCYSCDNFHGPWTCDAGGISGGTSCTVGQDSCTVSGNCNGNSHYAAIQVDDGMTLEIATIHPRLAGTVLKVSKNGRTMAETQVFWHDEEMTAEDVSTLLRGDQIGLEPGGIVIHKAKLILLGDAEAILNIVPIKQSPNDPEFSEFNLLLERSGGEGSYWVPVFWELH